MKKSIAYFIISVLVSSSACMNNKKNEDNTLFAMAPETAIDSTLKAISIVSIEDVAGVCDWGLSAENLWIVSDDYHGNIVNLYSRQTGKIKDCYGNFGQGPDEYITLNTGTATDKSHALTYDIMNSRVLLFAFDSGLIERKKILNLPSDTEGRTLPYTDIAQINDSLFLMKMDSDKSEWHIYNTIDAKIMSRYTNAVRNVRQSYTPFDYMQVCSDSILVAAYKYMELVEFYMLSHDGFNISLIKRYGSDKIQENLKDYNDLKSTYISAAAYDGKLFLLVSSDGQETGNVIESYDIRRQIPMERYKLDHEVNSIKFDSGGRLWGLVMAPDATMLLSFG